MNKNSKIKHDALIVKSHPHIVKKKKGKIVLKGVT